jgi:IS6 family transposase
VEEKDLPRDCKLRCVRYLNNVIEQAHRAVRRRWRAMQYFRSFHTAERTLEGIEPLHMLRKGQVKSSTEEIQYRLNSLRDSSAWPHNTFMPFAAL